jgi:starch phosphorylase
LNSFNAGNYEEAVKASGSAETITRVLYPNDNMDAGKELRLKQQYLWCCASLQDVLRRYAKLDLPWSQLPDYVVIQSETRPSIVLMISERYSPDHRRGRAHAHPYR